METKVTKTYVLYTGTGEARQPLCSDEDLDVVRAHKVDAVRDAFARGMARPELSITCRETSHPVDKNGKLLADGSTCEETDHDDTPAAVDKLFTDQRAADAANARVAADKGYP